MSMMEYVESDNAMPMIELITWNGKPLTYVIRAEVDPSRTTFLTPPEFKQQVGYVVYPAGGEVPRADDRRRPWFPHAGKHRVSGSQAGALHGSR